MTGKLRLVAPPDVPMAAESGMKDSGATSWTAAAVSSKVPDAIVMGLVSTPEFRKGLEEQGMSAVANVLPAAQAFALPWARRAPGAG